MNGDRTVPTVENRSAANTEIAAEITRLRQQVEAARLVILRGVNIMTTEQVGRWVGVRAWLEQDSDDYVGYQRPRFYLDRAKQALDIMSLDDRAISEEYNAMYALWHALDVLVEGK